VKLDPEVPRLARTMWKRFVLAALLIVVMSAGTTATAALLEVKDIEQTISLGGTKQRLDVPTTPAQAGAPQTILLLGSDVRKSERERGLKGNSDTMILVRLDPNKQATALLSIPRDLKATIRHPKGGVETAKINAAYSYGGPALTVSTIERNLPGITINHVVNINFRGFREAVNHVGCIYADIDRRYFNDNARLYAEIDVKPGYQKLCGDDALDYVRFRHEDTDLVRGARQQDFLRQAKDQLGASEFITDRKAFAKIFGRYADTDIRGTQELLRIFKLVAFSAGNPIREVPFQTKIGPSFVESSEAQKRKTVQEFLNPRERVAPRRGNLKPSAAERIAAQRRKKLPRVADGLEDAKTAGEDQAIEAQPKIRFPVYYPRLRTQGSQYSDVPRTYLIRDKDGKAHHAYRMVIKKGSLGEYYGVQGMDWKDAPIFEGKHETIRIGRRQFDVYFDGKRVRLIVLKAPRAVYYVSNTLLLSLDNRQMYTIAKSLQRIQG